MSTANLDSADLAGVARGGLINEDVMQKIWDISKIPLPLTELIGTGEASNQYKEWTIDELASPSTSNKVIDGADQDTATNNAATGDRVGNHCQISTKNVRVSTRSRNTDNIGRSDELAYQVMMRQRELRRDVEAAMLSENASIAGTSSVAGQSGALAAWIETNVQIGATGAVGGFNTSTGIVDAPTAGTAQPISEADLRSVATQCFQNNGNPSVLMSLPAAIEKISAHMFSGNAGIATLQSDVKEKRTGVIATGAVEAVVFDHGVSVDLVPNRIMQQESATRTNVFFLDPEYLEIAYLHGYRTEPLAKTGLSDKRMMAVDWTLIVKNEKALGRVGDANHSVAATA